MLLPTTTATKVVRSQIMARAGLPGQTFDQAVTLDQAQVYIEPHSQATHTFSYPISRLQNLVPVCRIEAPTIVQQHVVACPVCGGSGTEP